MQNQENDIPPSTKLNFGFIRDQQVEDATTLTCYCCPCQDGVAVVVVMMLITIFKMLIIKIINMIIFTVISSSS